MRNRIIIKNGKLIFPDEIKEGLTLVCENGKITRISHPDEVVAESGDRVVDAQNRYVSSGFIDIHTHGGGGHDFMDGTVEAYLGAAETHAKHGTTALLPTTLTSTFEELMKTFSIYKQAVQRNNKGAKFLGLHLEGPYFAYNQRGAQDPKYLRNPEPEEYNKILAASDDIVRWSLAPELPGAFDFGKALTSQNILTSIAHSDAIYEEVVEAFNAGFTHVTHLYSAMSTVTRRNAFRYAGVLEAAYLIDDMTVEIIADGVHLPKSLLQFVYKFKGPDKTALCTDSMRGAGMPDGESILGSLDKGQKVIIEDGVAKLPDRTAFAGSVATTDRLVRTMVELAEVPLVEAVRMMTLTPARIMQIDQQKGSIVEGKDADFVIFDDHIHVSHTILEGNVIYGD
ncbi:MAG: N-acetylglucosamine-6-phosphate deacetylase [Bacteroidetes bacterium GWD2_45_23]|nr:MAG: N-acetylglucosamine-6-phosphate deacetylase [Bacteroidetes bacterium GWC2_46_850]OFX75335.1 MAG: N-acetylglucosamine-6-phosphate deacetylase [Bacteroidetes bacterium GWC1_47_7]OFX83675.1 MAG: N-acetylglucosamine-6-phosphate deacetylase [Bacteroidetes bacterium GWD2_45_23]HBA99545.1 N-acetylglucosamine-6-phosphate deacetylase [Porphyromonadaceae bacterium]HCC18589.1 N-acetylglucosamine-6-phosphate deacetylase [Porphyromonadaceae bacterium]